MLKPLAEAWRDFLVVLNQKPEFLVGPGQIPGIQDRT